MDILHKGKNTVTGEWHSGYYCETQDGTAYIAESARGATYQVNKATVGTYTGYEDKNRTPIFTGDVTRLDLPDGARLFVVSQKPVRRTVKSHPSFDAEFAHVEIMGFVFTWAGFDLLPCVDEVGTVDTWKMEVVGNVHDPEFAYLLEVA